MSDNESCRDWIERLQAEESQATRIVWERFFDRLVVVARQKLQLHRHRSFDEEDVALSALNSFFEGVTAKKFPDLNNPDSFWPLLVVITKRKAKDKLDREYAEKRGGGDVRGDSVFSAGDADANRLSPQGVDAFAGAMSSALYEILETLKEPALQEVALLRLEGFTNDEIAERTERSLATVGRRLNRIREKLSTELEKP